ncbi:MAG TPA: ABC transporter ATP-binding protein [Ktedonobacteraceae bacterium]|jgi:ABC-type multidrug transport system fused ATPase/permease subunit|nr:ABC transporter ATP-binding protein [Ktedonobacteraceae bacterium]
MAVHWKERGFPLQISLKQYADLLVTYLKPQLMRVVLLAIVLLTNIALQLLNPQILKSFLDTALSSQGSPALFGSALLFFVIALISQGLTVASTYVSTNVGWTATNALRADLAQHCLQLDMPFHNLHTPGEMIDRLDGDVTILSNFFSQLIIQVLGNVILLLGVLLLLFQVDWRVGLALGLFVLVAALTLRNLRTIAVPHWLATRKISAESYSFIEERLAGTEDIRASGARAYTLRRFTELMRTRLRTQRKAGLVTSVMVNGTMLLIALGTVVAFAVSTYLYLHHVISIGTVYLIYYYSTMLTKPIDLITQQMDDLQKVGASIARIQELYALKITLQDGTIPFTSSGPLAVAFENVSFAYSDDDLVLRQVSFCLEPGSVLGLLGRTGSGKTSITRLLLRLYDPISGSIRMHGQDIRTLKQRDLRQRIGVVTQDVQLFHATVRDNLTLFDHTIPDACIEAVLQDLGLGDWYHSLPEGLETELKSGGGLSAGQAQLLALTRIFLADPGLVILDEASSRLDPATEQLLERAIDKLLHNRTAIIIAHRLTTVRRADQIVILEQGRIRESGERTTLLADSSSRFAQLVQTELQEVLV